MISPLILIPWVTHAVARGEMGSGADTAGVLSGALEGALFVAGCGIAAAGAFAAGGTACGFTSSFLHIRHLDADSWIFRSRRAGGLHDSET